MSRFDYDDYDSDSPQMPWEMWQHNIDRSISGRRGQKALREIRAALLAMPAHRLLRDVLVTEQGDACAIGALAIQRRLAKSPDLTREQVATQLMQAWGDEISGDETADVGRTELGLTYTLAWHLAQRNDEYYPDAKTPEQLWQATYEWVCKQIVEVAA